MSDRWKLVEAALEAALQVPVDGREQVLERFCGSDVELRREVESLLASHDEAEDFLATSAESFAAPFMAATAEREPGDARGQIVGHYRLLEEIGRGGMGTVWLAERADGGFEQKVAIKLIKRGMDTDEIVERFMRERQILARLEHPSIARLLDGGVFDDGRPYFAMELVRGKSITSYCDDNRLSVDARLRLFTVVARAVAFAHRNLVVHRDIKPSNVLVDKHGAIKLLDFGIAKLLDDDAEGDPVTRTAARLMTTEYASPEQIAGEQVTTSSDVYQLGLLLRELLTSRRPNEPDARRLKGDLDTIVRRALREEPELRYPSAESLAEDVDRHLHQLPILFGGGSARYRAAKFFRRHRIGVTSGVGLIAVIIGLTAFDAARVRKERDRARHEADKAIEISQLMARFLQGWSPDASDRGEVSAKKLLGEAALRAERELSHRPEMLGATLSILGDFFTTLGEWRAADSLLSRAQSIQRSLAASDSDLAATIARRGRLYRLTGRLDESISQTRTAYHLHREAVGSNHSETLRVQRDLATAYRDAFRFKEAEEVLRDVLAVTSETSGSRSPSALEVSAELGYVLFHQGRFDEAIAILRPALQQQRAMFGTVHASTLTTTRWLGSALRDRGDLEEAEPLYREAVRTSRALFGNRHPETQGALQVLALLLDRRNQLEEAEALARESMEISLAVHGSDHPVIAVHLAHLGAIRLDRGDVQGAERYLRESRARTKRVTDTPPDGDVLNRLAYVLVLRRARDADEIYREAVTFDDSRPSGAVDFVTDGLHFLAAAEREKGDLKNAEEDYRRAMRVYERQLPENHPYRIAAATGLARAR